MKIESGSAHQAYAAYRNQQLDQARQAGQAAPPAEGDGVKAQAPDRVDISADGRLRAQALEAARTAPDSTRAEKVEELRRQVQQGTYQINDHRLADQIVRHVDVRG